MNLSIRSITLAALLGAIGPAQLADPAHEPAPSRSGEPARLLFGDFDSDGLSDAIAVAPGGELRLFRNLGDGSFDDVSAFSGLCDVRGASLLLWQDYDGDRRPDLFVGTSCGPRYLFRNQGDGSFEDVTETSGLSGEGCDLASQWLDYDGDGRLDLHLEGAAGGRLYHALPDGRFEALVLPVSAGAGGLPPGGPMTVANALESSVDEPDQSRNKSRDRSMQGGVDPRSSSAQGPLGSGRVPLDPALVGLPNPGGTQPLQVMSGCVASIKDQANPAMCLKATSVPTAGMLFPPPHDGGVNNISSGTNSFIGGGKNNQATNSGYGYGHTTVGGGESNVASGDFSTVGGGRYNTASSTSNGPYYGRGYTTVGGGTLNIASGDMATVGGGIFNVASGSGATVGGGRGNVASGVKATVGGGGPGPCFTICHNQPGNTASGDAATVGGGTVNTASGRESTVGGGVGNLASSDRATVDGGKGNTASGVYATVGGGYDNTASGYAATVGGGGGYDFYLGGSLGNTALGVAATVPGGQLNIALGDYSFAAGRRAKANHAGAFVWGDNQDVDKTSSTIDEFNVYAEGGARFFAAGTSSPSLVIDSAGNVGIGTTAPGFLLEVNGSAAKPGGGAWSHSSDERLKKNIREIEGALETLLALRGVSFEYKDPAAIHELPGERIGFIAQEVEKVLPDWVEEGADGFKRLTVRGFEALAVEALREVHVTNQKLREANSTLAERVARLEDLETELADLRATVRMLLEAR